MPTTVDHYRFRFQTSPPRAEAPTKGWCDLGQRATLRNGASREACLFDKMTTCQHFAKEVV